MTNASVRNCIGIIQPVGKFYRFSARHGEVSRSTTTETLPETAHNVLATLCETRRGYKHQSVMRFKELYPAIIVALEKLESSINKEYAQKSCKLLSAVLPKCVIPLIVIENIKVKK